MYGNVTDPVAEQHFVQKLYTQVHHSDNFKGNTIYKKINYTMKDVSREGAYALLRGERGWEYYGRLADTRIRKVFMDAINGLQRVFKDVVWQTKESLKEAKDTDQYAALRLLDATLKYEEMTTESGKQNSQEKLWTQVSTRPHTEPCLTHGNMTFGG